MKIIDTYGGVDVGDGLAGRECTNLNLGSRRYGNDIRAVDEVVGVLANDCELCHDCFKFGYHRIMVIYSIAVRPITINQLLRPCVDGQERVCTY